MKFMACRCRLIAFLPAFSLLGTSSFADGKANPARDTYEVKDLVAYADPMCGTGGKAFTFPGAVAPFGMIQWSPDTEAGARKGGYSDQEMRISGFSLTHISGAGCSYGQDFQMMPLLDRKHPSPVRNRTAFSTSFSRDHEMARPGYYGVTLENGITVELTTTVRSGFARFRFPVGTTPTLAVNAASDVNGVATSSIQINPENHTLSGSATGGFFCHARDRNQGERTVYFYAVFDRAFSAYGTWTGDTLAPGALTGIGDASGAMVSFDAGVERTVLAKVAISYVSVENARANLEAENSPTAFASRDFDRAVHQASGRWNAWLNRIQLTGGTEDQRRTFYSMLYHALLAPSVVSDVNGQYLGYDGKVHQTADGRTQYGFFSGWDVYRTECPFLAMVAPDEASDMAESLLLDYQQGGAFPRWGVATQDSGTMVGDPSAIIIAGFHAFGATKFDTATAFDGLLRAANDPTVKAHSSKVHERDALADYIALGYVPQHQQGGSGSVSMTLEYASADFALSQLAGSLDDRTNEAALLQRAQNWRNLFNHDTGYLQMRRRDGTWSPGFAPDSSVYDGTRAYVEGTAGQYVWMVPFNLRGLAQAMGGSEVATSRLDGFLSKLNDGFESPHAYIGNEPSLGAPWIYNFIGRPSKTQQAVRRAITELFSPTPNAYPGNDDLGTLSSWYIFGALGLYPALPGSDVLVLGSPLFPKATLHLKHGDVTITGNGAAENAPFVQAFRFNRETRTKSWIRFREISRGGNLEFDLGHSPNPQWGTAPADLPPSYDGS